MSLAPLVCLLGALPCFAEVLEGDVTAAGPAFTRVAFEVPAGTVEVEVKHEATTAGDILDFGVEDPERIRGWGGGNTENAVIGIAASSRSYLTGALPAGTWHVIVGAAKVLGTSSHYKLEITTRTTATLAAQTARAPYVAAPALETARRWYAGDLHVHSRESGDAHPTHDEIADFARGRGLDFIVLTEHNTPASADFLADVQPRHPHLLLVPGVEWTTYQGHATAAGVTRYVDHRLGLDGVTVDTAATAVAAQGGFFSLNHPALDLGDTCIGCAWKQGLPEANLGGVEIQTGGYDKTGVLFSDKAIAFWERVLARGTHAAAIGGSDDHRGGQGGDAFYSPIGDPTTLVLANELSAPALLDALKHGRTVVKLQGPGDPFVELTAGEHSIGDVVESATALTLTAKVEGGMGQRVRLVKNGKALDAIDVTAEAFTTTLEVTAPLEGEDRYRAEVLIDGKPRTVTSHLWLKTGPAAKAGCGCSSEPGLALLAALLTAAVGSRRARSARSPTRTAASP